MPFLSFLFIPPMFRSTPLELIRRNKPEEGLSLFESETLRWPGFVEFDDVNGKVLTYSAVNEVGVKSCFEVLLRFDQ